MAYDFKLRSVVNSNGKTAHYAKMAGTNEPEFFVAFSTKYENYFGLYNSSIPSNLLYKADDYSNKFGFWAYFIEATAKAESKTSFICLNTYDRAYFTFGFMQFAAHVPNGDFVHFFKKLLALDNAKDYFPRLELINNRIFYKNANGVLSQLEDDNSSLKLTEYLNPSLKEVEHQELISAARFIHWATNDEAHRNIQVEMSIDLYKENMKKYHKRLNLNGYPAKVCFMVCDILHQGRGTYNRIGNALDRNNFEKSFQNLCTIGNVHYPSRISELRNHIKKLEAANIFNKTYNAAQNVFE